MLPRGKGIILSQHRTREKAAVVKMMDDEGRKRKSHINVMWQQLDTAQTKENIRKNAALCLLNRVEADANMENMKGVNGFGRKGDSQLNPICCALLVGFTFQM